MSSSCSREPTSLITTSPLRSKMSLAHRAASTREVEAVPAKSAETSPAEPLVSKKAKNSRKWISHYTNYEPCFDSKFKHGSIKNALNSSEENLECKIRKIYDFDKSSLLSFHNDSRWTYERNSFPEKSPSPNSYNLRLQTDKIDRAS